jgi:hypothetical protein
MASNNIIDTQCIGFTTQTYEQLFDRFTEKEKKKKRLRNDSNE